MTARVYREPNFRRRAERAEYVAHLFRGEGVRRLQETASGLKI
jgi:hypothetical protein